MIEDKLIEKLLIILTAMILTLKLQRVIRSYS